MTTIEINVFQDGIENIQEMPKGLWDKGSEPELLMPVIQISITLGGCLGGILGHSFSYGIAYCKDIFWECLSISIMGDGSLPCWKVDKLFSCSNDKFSST